MKISIIQIISLSLACLVALFAAGCVLSGDGPQPDADTDGDGWTDKEEAIAGTDPEKKDTDGDGFWDPIDDNPLIAHPTTTPPPTTTPVPTTIAPTTTPAPTPPPVPDLSSLVFAFDNERSSDSTCCRTGDIINKIGDLGAQTDYYLEDTVSSASLENQGIDVLVYGVQSGTEITEYDIAQMLQFVENGGVVWFAAITPGYDTVLAEFDCEVSFVRKTVLNQQDFYCSDDDYISYGIDQFHVGSIYTFSNLDGWQGSITIPGHEGYMDWPQVVYTSYGNGYVFCSNMSFYKDYHKPDNLAIFNNIVYFIGTLSV